MEEADAFAQKAVAAARSVAELLPAPAPAAEMPGAVTEPQQAGPGAEASRS